VFGAALLCASGGDRPPRRDRLDRLRARLEAGETFTATLAGARVEADTDHLRIVREAGDIARAGAPPLVLPRGEPVVWDGRFEIQAKIGGLWVEPLAGLTRRLGRAERSALTALRPAVRKSLPAIVDLQGGTSAPLLVPHARVSVRSLVASRFLAACGGVQNEADIAAHGETRADTLNR
jgi:tRNA(Ile)-lysidine synthase